MTEDLSKARFHAGLDRRPLRQDSQQECALEAHFSFLAFVAASTALDRPAVDGHFGAQDGREPRTACRPASGTLRRVVAIVM